MNANPVGPNVENGLEPIAHRNSRNRIADEELAARFGLEIKPLGEFAFVGGTNRAFVGNQVDGRVCVFLFPADLRRLESVAKAYRGALRIITGPPADRSGQRSIAAERTVAIRR